MRGARLIGPFLKIPTTYSDATVLPARDGPSWLPRFDSPATIAIIAPAAADGPRGQSRACDSASRAAHSPTVRSCGGPSSLGDTRREHRIASARAASGLTQSGNRRRANTNYFPRTMVVRHRDTQAMEGRRKLPRWVHSRTHAIPLRKQVLVRDERHAHADSLSWAGRPLGQRQSEYAAFAPDRYHS